MRQSLLFPVLTAGILGVAAPAVAQTAQTAQPAAADEAADADSQTIREIVVTAERRTSTAQKTAAAISVRSGDDLLAQGRYQLENILEDVPGINGGAAQNSGAAAAGGSDNPAAGLTIRGIQSNVGSGGSTVTAASSAAIYVDDVYNGIGGNYDIDRVEVLRGPQGTLYGRSATSGVVAIRTRNPDLNTLEANGSLEAGSYDLLHATGGLGIPLVGDKLAIRVSGNYYRRDGFYSYDKGGFSESTDGRVKLLFKPTENFSALLGFSFQNNNLQTAGVTINQPAPDQFSFVYTPYVGSENKYRQYWGEFNLDLGGAAITYIPALRTWTQNGAYITRGGFLPLDQTLRTPKDHFHTQELRLRSQNENSLQWQTGLAYYNNTLTDFNQVNFFPSGALAFRAATQKKTEAMGVFVEANWAVLPDTRITGGLRYDHTKVVTVQDYTSQLLITKSLLADEGTRKFNNVTYKARIEHDISPRNLVYGSISTGFTPGDVAVTTNAVLQPEVAAFGSQTLTAYEIGSKNRFAGDRLQLNAAAYYYDYDGFQAANVNLTPGSNARTFRTIVLPLTSYGLELEMVARPWRNGALNANFTYTHARYHDIPTAYASLFGSNEIPGVPPYEANASYTHTVPISDKTNFQLMGRVRYTASHLLTRVPAIWNLPEVLPYVESKDAAVGDLTATLSIDYGRFLITGYVRNVTDRQYKVFRTGANGTSLDNVVFNPNGSVNSVVSAAGLSEPRTLGIVLSARY